MIFSEYSSYVPHATISLEHSPMIQTTRMIIMISGDVLLVGWAMVPVVLGGGAIGGYGRMLQVEM